MHPEHGPLQSDRSPSRRLQFEEKGVHPFGTLGLWRYLVLQSGQLYVSIRFRVRRSQDWACGETIAQIQTTQLVQKVIVSRIVSFSFFSFVSVFLNHRSDFPFWEDFKTERLGLFPSNSPAWRPARTFPVRKRARALVGLMWKRRTRGRSPGPGGRWRVSHWEREPEPPLSRSPPSTRSPLAAAPARYRRGQFSCTCVPETSERSWESGRCTCCQCACDRALCQYNDK
ncbi:unnamed protein product [Nesidiocoris tenuis]|uniref:Uncharacterized protein n=1 Tax=Nesidiocoris tenuis TaxID=355587 RepID=A0A6H5HEG6_9HEMI|nr:unnamed protein product [Nesidiocoris tenuis]